MNRKILTFASSCLATLVMNPMFAALESPFDAAAIEAERARLEKEADLDPAVENGIGQKLLLIPAGTFAMGSTPEQVEKASEYQPGWWSEEVARNALAPETPQHAVTISRPFYMSATEVTLGQFRAFVEATGYKTQAERDGKGGMYYDNGAQEGPEIIWSNPRPGLEFGEDTPVTQVAHEDAVAFCRWLSEKEGVTYRLPTEAEWEWAVRGGTETIWYFGDAPEGAFDAHAHRGDAPTAVAEHKPNPFGLHDAYGNVWEWCADWFDPDYYEHSPEVDPAGPESGKKLVRRGGNFGTGPTQSRSAFRKGSPPDYKGLHVGFRIVRELP